MHNWRYLFVQTTSLKANVIWVLHLNSFEPFKIYLELLGQRYKYKRPSPSDSIWTRVNSVQNFYTHFTLKLNVEKPCDTKIWIKNGSQILFLRVASERIENYSHLSLEMIDSYSLYPRLIIKWPQNLTSMT